MGEPDSLAPTAAPSLQRRALIALALTVGFYLLAASIVTSLVAFLVFEIVVALRTSREIPLRPVVLAAAGLFAILRGFLLVSYRFEPPGLEIMEADEPRLFALVRDLAGRMGCRMPRSIYLVPEVNAFVAEVPGRLGLVRRRRIMGIGVPLLDSLTVGQLRAVLAHEFGHYVGGDTRLSGFLYGTRASIARVTESLGGNLSNLWLSLPFEAYARLFLRITSGIARQQELAADRFAVALAGREAQVGALRRLELAGAVFDEFVDRELGPIAGYGAVPRNVFEGFRRYQVLLRDAGSLQELVAAGGRATTDLYDSHPALPERIAFLESLPQGEAQPEPEPASSLLRDRDGIEERLTVEMLAPGTTAGAGAFDWDELPSVWAARMREVSAASAAVLGSSGGVTPVLRALARPDRRQLARELAPSAHGDRLEIPPEVVHDVLFDAAFATLGELLVLTRGCRWDRPMGGRLELLDARGERLPARALIEAATRDPGELPALQGWLGDQGVPISRGAA